MYARAQFVGASLLIAATVAPPSTASLATPQRDETASMAMSGRARPAATSFATPQGDAAVSATRIDIRFDMRPDRAVALIEADLALAIDEPVDAVTLYLRADLELDLVADESGTPLTFQRRNNRLRVSTPVLPAGSETVWRFRYRARFDETLEQRGQVILSTPWYPHFRRPADAAEFPRYEPLAMTLSATLPRPWVLVSSGVSRVSRNRNGSIDHVWSDSVPNSQIPLIVGRFVSRDKQEPVGYLRGFFPEDKKSSVDSYVEYMGAAATFFSDRIGPLRRRSWNLVAVTLRDDLVGVTVPGVTMIEAGNVEPRGNFPYRILAHEIAHHWWNHHIEIPRARDGWLREGLPTYSALLFLEANYGIRLMRRELERSRLIALAVDTGEALEMGFEMKTQEAMYAFNYHKAAVVLHMLREVMGGDDFARLYRALHEFDGDLTTAVFVNLAGEIYGEDLSWFFTPWLSDAAVPSFDVSYDVRRSGDNSSRYEIFGTITQRDAAVRHPVLLRIPLEAAPPLERKVWVRPGVSDFRIVSPSPPRDLEFDPHGDLLYRELTVIRAAPTPER